MRTLDQVIRNRVADDLARLAARWRLLYQGQSAVIGVPTRDTPFLDPHALARLRLLKRTSDKISALVSQIETPRSSPSNDRVYHRIRNNDQLLEILIEMDYRLATMASDFEPLEEEG